VRCPFPEGPHWPRRHLNVRLLMPRLIVIYRSASLKAMRVPEVQMFLGVADALARSYILR